MVAADGATLEFEREISVHLQPLHHLALRLTRNREDAEDLVQSALERAYRNRAHYRPGTNVRAWLNKILARLAIDSRRHQARAPGRASLDEAELACERQVAQAGVAPSPVEARVLDRLAAAALLDTLAVLRPTERMVVRATAAEFSSPEIARRLGIPDTTVRTRLRRGRQRLRVLRSGAPDTPRPLIAARLLEHTNPSTAPPRP